jgi:hypothetical protein
VIPLALGALLLVAALPRGCSHGRTGVYRPHEGLELMAKGGRLVRVRRTHSEREI